MKPNDNPPPPSPINYKRRILGSVLGLIISAFFVYLTFQKIELSEIFVQMKQVRLEILVWSLLTKLFAFVFLTLRSSRMMRPLHEFPTLRLFKSLLLAFTGNNVLPFRLGELLRVDYLAQHGKVPHTSVLATIAVERLQDLFVVAMIFMITVPAVAADVPIKGSFYLFSSIIAGGLTCAVLASRNPTSFVNLVRTLTSVAGARVSGIITRKAEDFAHGLGALASVKEVLLNLFLTLAYWGCSLGSLYIWSLAFGLTLPWYAGFLIISFLAFGTALPSSPGFVGTYHYFMILALTTMGISETQAASFAVVGHATAFVPFTLVGIVVFLVDISRGDLRLPSFSRGGDKASSV